MNVFPIGSSPGQNGGGHGLVDDRHLRGLQLVLRRQASSCEQGHAQRGHIVRVYDHLTGPPVRRPVFPCLALQEDGDPCIGAAERKGVGGGGAFHAWNALNAFIQSPVEGRALIRFRVHVGREIDRSGDDAVGLEPQLLAGEGLERPQKEAGPGEQDDGQDGLGQH